MAQMMLTAARAAIPLVGQAVTGALLNGLGRGTREGHRLPELHLQTSTPGTAMPQVWGRVRLAGQVIWAARYREHASTSRPGGKGAPRRVDHTYSLSFAVGLCAGEISGIGRIWANGSVLDAGRYAWRLHTGREDQMPDALISAVEGEAAPAFRGTAYLVFEVLPLDAFGHRIPNLSVEVFRPGKPGGLETQVRAINLIPGSGEFAYHPEPVVRSLGPGRARAENHLPGREQSNLLSALDELERDLPNCRSVQLVVSWFGTDLRCGACEIRPGVETREKQTRPVTWQVAGTDRQTARLVSHIDGRPAYGGTPDDASIVAAIRALKARGFSVTLYPFILMDIAPGNGLPDPYGQPEQAAFPWRGRIRPEDGAGASISEQVAAFFGATSADSFPDTETVTYTGPAEWRFNRFILHCAALARAAGGVDGFLIGSEMVALTGAREAGVFPAVEALCRLATEARTLLGPQTRLSYAADWTEYSGVQGANGAKSFHLDPLWAHPAIDAVAIDWYVPLGDWRNGSDHLDAAIARGPHDRDYLAGQVAGGEGWDWYYATPEDRQNQTRTPITDGEHNEAWVWRYKDLLNWWRQPHHDRPGGVRSDRPTAWVPEGKPIWLTEIGCPAVDRGANQPNVFVDPKSDESALPYGSNGGRDDLIQRRYLEVMLAHWSSPGNNPVSSVYGGPMVPEALIHVWTWDARPWPDFPARTEIWSDGANWQLGHWLNGRAGLVPVGDIVEELAGQAGLVDLDVSGVDDLVAGFVAEGGRPARDTLEPLLGVLGLKLIDTGLGPRLAGADRNDAVADLDDFVVSDADTGPMVRRTGALDRIEDVRLRFLDDVRDYEPGSARAGTGALTGRCQTWTLPLVAHDALARHVCAARLADLNAEPSLQLALPPSCLALEAGDAVRVGAYRGRIEEADGGLVRDVRLASAGAGTTLLAPGGAGLARAEPADIPAPILILADLPPLPGREPAPAGLAMVAACEPWPDRLSISVDRTAGRTGDRTGSPRWEDRAVMERPGVLGHLVTAAGPGPSGRWDNRTVLDIELVIGALSSVSTDAVLDGGNRLAVQTAHASWEVLQFANAELVGPDRYRVSRLLRGQTGAKPDVLAAGAPCFLLDEAVEFLPLRPNEWGAELRVRAMISAGPAIDPEPVAGRYHGHAMLQPEPVHIQSARTDAGLALRWQRQSLRDVDDWDRGPAPLDVVPEAYRVQLHTLTGETVFDAETAQPECLLSPALLSELGAGGVPQVWLSVRQIGADGRPGRAGRARLDL